MVQKKDPMLEKVDKEGLFGKRVQEVDLSRPFEEKKPEPETIMKKARPVLDPKLQNELNTALIILVQLPESRVAPDKVVEFCGKIQEVIDQGADVNCTIDDSKVTPLMVAVREGNWRIFELLLKNGADQKMRDKYGNTARDYELENLSPPSLH